MKNKTKKIMAIILLVLTLCSSLPISSFATFITDINSNATFGVISGSLSAYGHELHYANYDGGTYILFCTQYGKTSPTGKEYTYNGEFIAQYKNNRPEYEKIAEMIYFGYTMKYGMGLPTSTEAKRAACATQQYVWEYIHNNIDGSSKVPGRDSWNVNYMSSGIYASWLNQTESDYNQYYRDVSFNGENRKIDIGDETTFTDTNGVLQHYASFNKTINGVTFKHDSGSNDLRVITSNGSFGKVTFNSSDYGIYELMPNGAEYSKESMSNYVYFQFNSGTVQNLIFSNYVDPSRFLVSVDVQSGNILIKKTNNIGNPVAGCNFDLYKDEGCTQKVASGTSGSNGELTFNNLKVGTYFVRETSVPEGYLIDNTIKRVNVANGQTVTVDFMNNEPTGKILIYKVNENGDKVNNATFIVTAKENITNVAKTKTYYTKGQVVATITTENGVASIDNLPMGSYEVKESSAPTGYLLNETVYTAKLEYKNSVTPVVEIKVEGVVNKEPTGTITIIKRDSETGATPQGDATFVDAKYEVYANEDIYNVAKTKKYYSKGDLVATRTMNDKGTTEDITDLPLGKYVVKEKVSSEGYLLDEKEYDVDLKYKDQNTKVISETITSNEVVKKMQVHIFKSGIKVNSGETPGLEGAEFTIKLNRNVEEAYSKGYTYEEVWNGIDESGNKVTVDENRVKEAQAIAPSYAKITTDKDGNAYTQNNLPYGKYIVKETATPKDYETAVDFTFSITKDECEIQEVAQKAKHLIVNNEQLETYIKLVKKDLKTDKVVSLNSATFQIKATRDIYDRATGKILYKKGEAISQKIGSTTFTSFTTNSENLVVPDQSYNNDKEELGTIVTPLKLEVGSYEVTEIKIPQGFLQLEQPVQFDVKGLRDYDKDQDGDYIKEVIVKNEQPTGTLIVNKCIALREDIDTSLVDTSDLSGIQFKLTAKEEIKSPIDGSIIYKTNQEVGKYNLDKNGDLKIQELPMGTYELVEIKTLDGLVLNNKKYEIEFTQKDLVTKVYEIEKDILNDTILVEFSKQSITGDKELAGAKLTVIDENNKVVDTWASTEKAHTIEGLIVGKTYTLREEIAPDGFVRATDVKFKVENTNEVQKVEMIDKIVTISKKDIGGEEIEGAELKVVDEDGNIVDSWTSTKESHNVKGLEENKTYTLYEDYAPDGFVVSNKIIFTVTTDKEIQKVEMIDKVVEVSKVNIAGEELEGATLIVTNTKTKQIVDKWLSEKEPHKVNGLVEGQTYLLHEEIVVNGYVKASDIEFTVTSEKEVQKVVMIDKIVEIVKTDLVTGEEVEGAELKVIDEDGNIIDEWTSTKEAHIVKGLEEGKNYKLVEITAPYGFEIAEEISFTVTEDKETQRVEMKDMPILQSIKLVKVDANTKETIKDKFTFGIYEDVECTKLIKEVEANKEDGTVLFSDLRYGNYYIKEIKAPKGYVLSDKVIKVEINDKGVFIDDAKVESEDSIYTFEFENVPVDTPKTGDNSNLTLWVSLLGLSIIALVSVGVHEYKKRKLVNKK